MMFLFPRWSMVVPQRVYNWLITLSSTTRRRATPFIGGYGSVPIQQHLLDDYIFHVEAIFDYPDWGAGGYRDV